MGTAGLLALELVLIVATVLYARHLFRRERSKATLLMDQASRLAEANELLVSLHRVAQSMPASLNLAEASTSTMARLRSLVDCDVAVLLVRDPSPAGATRTWAVGVAEGVEMAGPLDDDALPVPLRVAAASSGASLVVTLAPDEGLTPSDTARSGMYAALRCRDELVGLVALEHHEPGFYGRRELRLLDGFVGPAALALDNARWFSRLRAMGADEERNRIARDMHDRVGQSLAYLSFRLERLGGLVDDGPLREELVGLRSEVRGVLGEVRETLSDLRADVTDSRGITETLAAFCERVGARADVEVSLSHRTTGRLPLVQERELWRIAQEAMVNAERHSKARHLRVRWECDGRSALLIVADDGRGFSLGKAGRGDSYGITGMRERADAIGARLSIESEPYVGTVVECRLGPVEAVAAA